jgi:quercetin dioxygenase-like cupin family protein
MSIQKVDISVLENNTSFKILFGQGKEQAVLKPHMVDIDAFLLVQKGKLLFNIDNTGHLLSKGEHIKIPKNKVHSLEVIKNCEFLITLNSKTKMSFA